MARLAVGMLLAFHTLTDIKERMIFVPAALLGVSGGIVYGIYMRVDVRGMSIRLLAGILFLAAAAVSKEAIGAGDGWAILSVALFMDPEKQLIWLMLTFLMAALAALFLLSVKKANAKTEIALAPFMLGAYLGGWYGGIL